MNEDEKRPDPSATESVVEGGVPEGGVPEGGVPEGGVPEGGVARRSVRQVGARSFLELFPQLFLIPLLLVTVGVLIYLFFVAIGKDGRSVDQILADMESGGAHSRQQDAYTLAQRVMERAQLKDGVAHFTEAQTQSLIRILEKAPDDGFTRVYAAKALGWAGQPGPTQKVLQGRLSDPAVTREERAALIQALGFTRQEAAVPSLLSELERAKGSEEWEMRLYAIVALVQISKSRPNIDRKLIVAALKKQVGDPQREVAWNTAYYLASVFGDAGGAEVLRQLLDVHFLDALKGDRGRELTDQEKQTWMLHAIRGLHRLEGDRLRDELTRLRVVATERNWLHILDEIISYLGQASPESPEGKGK